MHGDDLEARGDPRDGSEILDWIVARPGRYRGDHCQSAGIAQQQGIAVLRSFRDFPCADRTASTRAMLENDRLPEFRIEDLRGQTSGKIRRTSGRCSHDDLDRLRQRDLRNGSVVKNVTRSSARKLWHYAISAKESGALNPEHVSWQGDVGLWRKTHKGGATRYDLVQRGEGGLRVYYGVTEDGIHGVWRRLLEAEERRTGVLAPAGMPANGQPAASDVYAGELAPGPEFAAAEASGPPPVIDTVGAAG